MENEFQKQYSYISRYAPFRYHYNQKDNKYAYGLTSQLSQDTQYIVVKVNKTDTLDSLAAKYYGRPDYFWAIADFNRIIDPFTRLTDQFLELKIPTITAIEYEG